MECESGMMKVDAPSIPFLGSAAGPIGVVARQAIQPRGQVFGLEWMHASVSLLSLTSRDGT